MLFLRGLVPGQPGPMRQISRLLLLGIEIWLIVWASLVIASFIVPALGVTCYENWQRVACR